MLHLLLSMIIPISWLERNPTYKEKQEEIKERDLSTYGFLGYPVLQAADILIYKPDLVPVGKVTNFLIWSSRGNWPEDSIALPALSSWNRKSTSPGFPRYWGRTGGR